MLNKYKHFSFDLDGTLVYTSPEYRYNLVTKIVEKTGGRIKEKSAIDRFWFETTRDQIIKKEFLIEPEVFWPFFRENDVPEQRAKYTFAYDDAERILIKLKELNRKVSILTGSPDKIAQLEIKKLNNAPCDFYFSITSSEFKMKPAPESFHYVLQKMGVLPQETVYIGNSCEDADFAKNAGVDFIFLERNAYPFDLKDYAVSIINSLDDLFND